MTRKIRIKVKKNWYFVQPETGEVRSVWAKTQKGAEGIIKRAFPHLKDTWDKEWELLKVEEEVATYETSNR